MFYSCILKAIYVFYYDSMLISQESIANSFVIQYAQASYGVLSEIGSFLKFIINGFFV